jgi:hypothetical protein
MVKVVARRVGKRVGAGRGRGSLMSWRLIGPRCDCGLPLTPADGAWCTRCVLLARSVGSTLDEIRTDLSERASLFVCEAIWAETERRGDVR